MTQDNKASDPSPEKSPRPQREVPGPQDRKGPISPDGVRIQTR